MDGKSYLVEVALRADFALVQAFLADYLGNLGYALTARNFNPVIAMAAATVIASADNIVPVGVISPDHVVTPAPLVDYPRRQCVSRNGPADHHRATDRAGAAARHAGQSRHRHSDPGGELPVRQHAASSSNPRTA